MSLHPTTPESLQALRQLRSDARDRGDAALSVLLGGVELYVSLGREFELIELMKNFADTIKPTVDQTPTADDLRRMFEDPTP